MERRKVCLWLLVGLLAGSTVLVAAGNMSVAETRLLHFVYDMSDQLERIAILVTQLGSGWVWLFIVALLLVVRRNPKLALLVLRNGALAYIFAEVLKHIVERPRPYELVHDIVAREIIVHGSGFPSGHTAMAAALGLTLWPYLPKGWRWVVPAWIGLVAWSRMYLGVHAPLDVVGGFAIGALVAMIPLQLHLQKHKRRRRLKKEV